MELHFAKLAAMDMKMCVKEALINLKQNKKCAKAWENCMEERNAASNSKDLFVKH